MDLSIPEFSEKDYKIAGYIVGAAVTLSGVFLIYEVLSTDQLNFSAEWNMFKSPLGTICYFLGLIWAIAWWGKFTHWSATPVVETRDSSGNLISRKENMDIIEQIFAKFFMPILGHFVIEPLIYGAIIYYPIQCVIAILGVIFPYIVALFVLAIIALSWLFSSTFYFRYHSAVLVCMGLLFTAAFALGGYYIKNDGQMSTSVPSSEFFTDDGASEQVEVADNPYSEEANESDEQFEDVGEEGLYGSLPNGMSTYEGEMGSTPIAVVITKDEETCSVSADVTYKSNGCTLHLEGESLPAMGGNIVFYSQEGGAMMSMNLTGDASNITGTVRHVDNEMNVTLRKK